jgi:anti-anti-sigma regulatory factor
VGNPAFDTAPGWSVSSGVSPLPIVHEAIGPQGPVRLELRSHGRGVILSLDGAWHEAIPDAVVRRIQAALQEAKPQAVAVDLARCTHLVSVALGFLVLFYQAATAAGSAKAHICAPAKIATLIRILGLGSFFQSVATPAELEKALA